jgi:hypothetical protein
MSSEECFIVTSRWGGGVSLQGQMNGVRGARWDVIERDVATGPVELEATGCD